MLKTAPEIPAKLLLPSGLDPVLKFPGRIIAQDFAKILLTALDFKFPCQDRRPAVILF
jgi:hypothetical protein